MKNFLYDYFYPVTSTEKGALRNLGIGIYSMQILNTVVFTAIFMAAGWFLVYALVLIPIFILAHAYMWSVGRDARKRDEIRKFNTKAFYEKDNI